MLGLALILALQAAPPAPRALERVEVTASARATDAVSTTAAKAVIDAPAIARTGPGIDLGESLARVPGVLALQRWNFAQDTQLSVRGYGARASFGVRGVRVYVNGIPATAPDGQSQVGHVVLSGVDRIDVTRGPLATLYGNASAAVIRVETDAAGSPSQTSARVTLGDFARVLGAGWRAGQGAIIAHVDAEIVDVSGFRDHARARRANLDAGARGDWGEWQWSSALNVSDTPRAEDPLGLTAAQLAEDPRGTAPVAEQFDTRKRIAQQQLGLALRRDADIGRPGLSVAIYGGTREVEQYLAIAPTAQRNPLSGGGVVDLRRDYFGVESRAWQNWDTASGEWRLDLGVNLDTLDEARRGYENFIGDTLGTRGALRRNEANRVRNLDALVAAHWRPSSRWRALAGVRHGQTRFRSRDHFITAANPDDSGKRDFNANNPVIALFHEPDAHTTWHLALARATESPTVNELAYRVDGSAGFNRDLRAMRVTRRELGLSWRQSHARIDAAVFDDEARDDIVVARAAGGRTSFRNEPRSTRRGLEAGIAWQFDDQWEAQAQWTLLSAQAADGRHLPGVPSRYGTLDVTWSPNSRWSLAWQARHVDRLAVDDAATTFAPGSFTQSLLATHRRDTAWGEWQGSLRIDNLADRDSVGSVIVNDTQGRYFEPAPGRTAWLSAQWRWR